MTGFESSSLALLGLEGLEWQIREKRGVQEWGPHQGSPKGEGQGAKVTSETLCFLITVTETRISGFNVAALSPFRKPPQSSGLCYRCVEE